MNVILTYKRHPDESQDLIPQCESLLLGDFFPLYSKFLHKMVKTNYTKKYGESENYEKKFT